MTRHYQHPRLGVFLLVTISILSRTSLVSTVRPRRARPRKSTDDADSHTWLPPCPLIHPQDLKKLYGMLGKSEVVFLFTDAHVVEEGFLEFINNMLTTGMVPALFEQVSVLI